MDSSLIKDHFSYVREKLPFSVVFSHYGIPWLKDTTHQLSCPFHGPDAHPSSRYYADSKKFYCFACTDDPGGDVVWFIKKKQGFQSWDETFAFIKTTFNVFFDESDLKARMALQAQYTSILPRKKFIERYRDRMNDLLYRLKQDPRVQKIDLSLLERDIWDRFREIESPSGDFSRDYVLFCTTVRMWFDESYSMLKEFLSYHLPKG